METILEWDRALFLVINHLDFGGLLDKFLVMSRHKLFWAPLYVFLLSYIFFNFSGKKVLVSVLMIATTIAISDTMSSKVIKPGIGRERPCNDLALRDEVDLKVRCGSGKSFTSSHATNHFALAGVFLFIFYGFGSWRWLFLVWAGLISFAQVFVGVHYPVDVFCGGCLGLVIAFLCSRFFSRWWSDPPPTADIA